MQIHFRNAVLMLISASALILSSLESIADSGRIAVGLDRPGARISPMLYGLMTEEINHSYDGGIYGELIQNRVFKDSSSAPVHWSVVQNESGAGDIQLDVTDPINKIQTTCLKFGVKNASASAKVGVANTGFWGIPIRPECRFRATFAAKADRSFRGPLIVALESADGKTTWANATVNAVGPQWHQFQVTLVTHKTGVSPSSANRFVIYAVNPGTIWLNQVSLFPPTFKNRSNGNRIDLMQKLDAMKPAFLRLPGGNYLEGNYFDERFAWKDTLGDIWLRPGHRCPWGYRSSDGLGLLEYLEWCEDLKMEPILAVFAGYALRGQHVDAGTKLQPYVDEALDEIEYVTGDVSTRWGGVRASDGHPAPFKLTYVEVGNEDSFDRSGSYDGRFAQFFDAIRAKYPKLQVIATTPVSTRIPDVVDDHYYRSAADMERDAHHYDRYPRTGPKIFVGEWASTEGSPTPTMQAALGDAAWMTGMERNSDLIPISCYAPLFVNINPGARQWGTNLIGYDALNSFGSPSYYVQCMFANNRGDVVLPVEITPQKFTSPASANAGPAGAVGVGTWATHAEYRDMKVTSGDRTLLETNEKTSGAGWRFGQGNWSEANGLLAQTTSETDCRATTGDVKWTNYTYSLKARKVSGEEGFLVMFHVQDSENYIWWNIGGWGNSRSALERARAGGKRQIGRASDIRVETGRWYDIRIEVEGDRIRCYLDNKLVTEATDQPGGATVDPLYATASRDVQSGNVIVKVVNVSGMDQQIRIDLQGAGRVTSGFVLEMKGEPGDVNSVTEPVKVAPTKVPLLGSAGPILHTFPAHSVTVLRIRVGAK